MLEFSKMQATGNDFIVLDGIKNDFPKNLSDLARKWCHRRFGIGADQLLVLRKGKSQKFFMEIWNADGSQAEMCGNGIRSFAHFLKLKKYTSAKEIVVETLGGVVHAKILSENGFQFAIQVDMGAPSKTEKKTIEHEGRILELTTVSFGNPHAVVFVNDLEHYPVAQVGPFLEHHPFFPNRTNVEFVQVKDRNHLLQRTWERGSGETFACGTGACAVTVVASGKGLCGRSVEILLKGGRLDLFWDHKTGHVFLTGPSVFIFEGAVHAF